MPDSSSKSVPPGVKEGIEELALRMVLGGGWDAEQATHLDEALERVEAAATGEDWGSLARRAQELRAMVADAQCDEESDPREIELRVHAGVVNLQRMLTLQGSSHRGAPPAQGRLHCGRRCAPRRRLGRSSSAESGAESSRHRPGVDRGLRARVQRALSGPRRGNSAHREAAGRY